MKLQSALDALGALAQETRLAIYRLLVRAGNEGLNAGQIAESLDIPAPTLSFHLKELARADLITPQREGRSIRYTLCVETMREFLTFLSDDCCQGRPELCLPHPTGSPDAESTKCSGVPG